MSPTGRIPYGYRRLFDSHSRKFLGVEIVPEQAQIISYIFWQRNKGATLDAIATDLQGVSNGPGDANWSPTAVWRILRNEAKYRGGDFWPQILENANGR